jgi:hypothetical protein
MDEIVKPLRDIQMDDTEYTCLKAIVFFDPSNKKTSIANLLFESWVWREPLGWHQMQKVWESRPG